MLRKLVWKDFVLGRFVLALNGGLFACYICVMPLLSSVGVRLFVVMSGLMCAFLPISVIAREDKLNAQRLICSLPVTRSWVVLARYVLSLGLGAGGVLAAILIGILAPWSHLPHGELLSARTILFGLTVIAVATAIVLPILQRFGIWGLFGFLIGSQLLGIVVMMLATILGRANPLNPVVNAFVKSLVAYHGNLAGPLYATAGMAVLLVFLAVSYLIALAAFEGREL